MSHTPHCYSKPADLPLRLMLMDGRALVERYVRRNRRGQQISAADRKAWAAQVVALLNAMTAECENRLGFEPGRKDAVIRVNTWDLAYSRGERFVRPLADAALKTASTPQEPCFSPQHLRAARAG